MDSQQLLTVAGDAACLLDELGFTAVARLRAGSVLLELWRDVGDERRAMRHVLGPTDDSAEALVQRCVAAFRAGVAVR